MAWLHGNINTFLVKTKTNDFELHVLSLQKFCPPLFIGNNCNYPKCLRLYFVTVLCLPDEAKSLDLKKIKEAVSKSDLLRGELPLI